MLPVEQNIVLLLITLHRAASAGTHLVGVHDTPSTINLDRKSLPFIIVVVIIISFVATRPILHHHPPLHASKPAIRYFLKHLW